MAALGCMIFLKTAKTCKSAHETFFTDNDLKCHTVKSTNALSVADRSITHKLDFKCVKCPCFSSLCHKKVHKYQEITSVNKLKSNKFFPHLRYCPLIGVSFALPVCSSQMAKWSKLDLTSSITRYWQGRSYQAIKLFFFSAQKLCNLARKTCE